MFTAAKDYLRTAERLDAAADGIRRGATDLADSWHGTAADESQQHLRQYYASARSLAAASRSSAAALNYAATALGAAQAQVFSLPGGAFPSLDPTSLQSLVYQKVLADLNAAYRDATTLAPTQIAVCLPRGNDSSDPGRVAIGDEWEDLGSQGSSSSNLRESDVTSKGTSGGTLGWPAREPPSIPVNPRSADHSGNGHHFSLPQVSAGLPSNNYSLPIVYSPPLPNVLPAPEGSANGSPSPYDPASSL